MNISLSCPQCQQQVELGDCFCQECGARLEFAVITTADVDRNVPVPPVVAETAAVPEPALKEEVAARADLLLSDLFSQVEAEPAPEVQRTASILRHRPHNDRVSPPKTTNKKAIWVRPSTDAVALMVMVSYSVLLLIWFVNSQTRDLKNNPVKTAAKPVAAPVPSNPVKNKEKETVTEKTNISSKPPVAPASVATNSSAAPESKSAIVVKDAVKQVIPEEKPAAETANKLNPSLEAVQEHRIPRNGTFFVGRSGSGSPSSVSSGVIIEESPNQSKSDKKQIAEAVAPSEEYQDKDVAEYHRLLANYFEKQKDSATAEGPKPEEPPSYGEWLNLGKPAF